MKVIYSSVCASLLGVAVLLCPLRQASAADSDLQSVARLSLEVQRLEDLRAVKRVQMSYSQYSQAGLWSQMAGLFADNAEAIYGNDDLKGRAAIEEYFRTKWGNGHEGLPAGGVRANLDDTPIVNLSDDGKSARGRFEELAMMGQLGGSDDAPGWAIGIMENVYVKENGVWKISFMHYYPYVAGSYKSGWKDVGPELPVVTYHYTPASVGTPVPPIPGDLAIPPVSGSAADALASVNRRVMSLNDEDQIRNVQNSYGYYIDRKMWDDAADLFTSDAVLEEADVGIYIGARDIRRSFDRFGPPLLKRGQLNEHPLFATTVTVEGNEARVRGVEWRELGDVESGKASLGLGTFLNRYVKGPDGKWRIHEMRIFPLAMTDYYQGWQRSRLTTPPVTGKFAPNKPVPDADKVGDRSVVAFFQNHPVTGQQVVLPAETKVLGVLALAPSARGSSPSASTLPMDIAAGVAEVRKRLLRSVAYDSIDNVTHAFGQYINDNDFDEEAALYAQDGWRGKQAVGFHIGPEHVAVGEATWGASREVHFDLPSPRTSLSSRWMMQPVIIVSDDGLSAVQRTRLHSFAMSATRAGVLSGAMYNDQFKLVNGKWMADVISIEEPYWSSSSYEDGWARYKNPAPQAPRLKATDAPDPLPPDIDRTQKLKIRFYGINNHPDPKDIILWPDIKPMWFNYVNPVSGRLPPNFCPNMKTCEKDLEAQGHVPVH